MRFSYRTSFAHCGANVGTDAGGDEDENKKDETLSFWLVESEQLHIDTHAINVIKTIRHKRFSNILLCFILITYSLLLTFSNPDFLFHARLSYFSA
jgi:hypothetical protein